MTTFSELQHILRSIYIGLLNAIHLGTLFVADHVLEFLKQHDQESTWAIISAAIMPVVLDLVNGIPTSFTDLSPTSLFDDTLTRLQGVYAVVVYFTNHEYLYRMYVGSAFGKDGVGNRVHHGHFNQKHRDQESGKYLYRCMEHANADPWPVCLAQFPKPTDAAIVIILEAMMACTFGTYATKIYKELRPSVLPPVDWASGVNQSDPLSTGDNRMAWKYTTASKRLRKLQNARAGGPVKVRRESKKGAHIWLFETVVVSMLTSTADAWDLKHGSTVNMSYIITEKRHPHAWATRAPEQSDAAKLAIQCSKQIDGKIQTVWLQGHTERNVLHANSLYDWICGRIDEDVDNYDWGSDRFPLFGAQNPAQQALKAKPPPKKHAWSIKSSNRVPLLDRPQLSLVAPGQPALGKRKREEEEEDEKEEGDEADEEGEEEEDYPEYEHDMDSELRDYQAQLYYQYLDDKYGAAHRKLQRLGIALVHGTPLDKGQFALYKRLVELGIVKDF